MNKKTKLVIKENFDEDDLSDDVDDEVFVRDGKKCTLNVEKHKCDELPLMPARRKNKQRQNQSSPHVCSRQPCNIYNCLLPIYFGVAAIISIAFLLLLYIFLVDKLPVLMNRFDWGSTDAVHLNNTTAPCSDFKLNRIWIQKIPKLLSDSQMKLMDVDRDGIDDIIIGTGTELEDALNSQRMCSEKNEVPCLGGVIALNGKTGSMLWKVWLTRMVLSVHCDFEITGDSIPDCVITGREGLLLAVSGVDGSIIWERKSTFDYELYNVLIIRDFNQDGYQDILASHYSKNSNVDAQSCILIICGKTEKTLHQLEVPSDEPILHAPQIMPDSDGGENIIIVTGDMSRSGSLYVLSMHDLFLDDNTKIKLLHRSDTGILAVPLLVDVNSDGIHDILLTTSNALFALDGANYSNIWNTSFYDFVPKVYQITATSSVTPTYFDDDIIPDFLLTLSVGSTFPEYYYSMMLILNGKNGHSLLNNPITRSGVADTVGGISLSFDGFGNDAFIYWMSMCKDYVDAVSPFSFLPTEDRQFFIDLCSLRFNSSSQIKLYALNQHVEPPGVLLKSESWIESWDYKLNGNVDLLNEQATSMHKIKADYRPEIFDQQQISQTEINNIYGKKTYSGGNGKPWSNSWQPRKSGLETGEPASQANENLSEQMQVNEYGPENTVADDGRDEREYDIPSGRGRRFKKNSQFPALQVNNDKMLPKVSASGVLSKAFEGSDNGIDLILMHYEVKANNDVCINTNKELKCSQQNNQKINHYEISVADKTPEGIIENNLMFPNQKYSNKNPRVSQFSNLYISRHHLTCSCIYLKPEHKATCSKILPYEKQSYPAYLGRLGNSAYRKREIISLS